MSKLVELFGEKLQTKEGNQQDTTALLAGKKYILLYFSAHWCPPCRGFTPKLAEWYTTDLKRKDVEVIFASSDRDEGAFDEYYKEMPWLSIPYADRERKSTLNSKYKVNGIPALIVLDGQGEMITTNGRKVVSEDPKCESDWNQWRALTRTGRREDFVTLLGDTLLKQGETVSTSDALAGKKVVGLYFSAHWCPPCRGFTPKLAAAYKDHLQGKDVEIVFVSSDRDENGFKEYYADMPFLALPYDRRIGKELLSELFGIEGIPTLIILNGETAETLNKNGVGCVGSDPEGKNLPWLPEPVNEIDVESDGIDEVPALVVLMEKASSEEQARIKTLLTPIGKRCIEANSEEPEFKFFTASSSGQLADKVRALTKQTEDFAVVLMNIPDNGGFYNFEGKDAASVTTASIEKLLQDFKAKTLTRQQMG